MSSPAPLSAPAGSVLIVGMGGLGCPASLAVARAGVRQLTLVDGDRVELSNLHRQPWYRPADVGHFKVEVAGERLTTAFPGLAVRCIPERATVDEIEALVAEHAWTVDGTDDLPTKYALSDAATCAGRRVVFGGVLRMDAQVMCIEPGGPCLRCAFGPPAPLEELPTCAQAGVLGSVAGVAGALQALVGLAPRRGGDAARLHVLDGASLRVRTLSVPRTPGCSGCGGTA